MTSEGFRGCGARCARCGAAFACGADRPVSDPCWCTAVALGGTVLERLARTFEGCLCPACLEAHATSAAS